jgi:hypothetical protein
MDYRDAWPEDSSPRVGGRMFFGASGEICDDLRRHFDARSNAAMDACPFFCAQAKGVAQSSASASTGSAPRARNNFTRSGRPQRQAQPSGVLFSRASRISSRAPASSSAVANPTCSDAVIHLTGITHQFRRTQSFPRTRRHPDVPRCTLPSNFGVGKPGVKRKTGRCRTKG